MSELAALRAAVDARTPAEEVAGKVDAALAAAASADHAETVVRLLLDSIPAAGGSGETGAPRRHLNGAVTIKGFIKILAHTAEALRRHADKDALLGATGALQQRTADLYDEIDNDEEEGEEEDDDDDDDVEDNMRRRLEALSAVDVAQTHAFLARRSSAAGAGPRAGALPSLDEFKMQLHVQMAQCHFQLGDVEKAQAALIGIQSYSSANIAPWTLVSFRSCFAETLFRRGDHLKASSYFLAVANTTGCEDRLTPALVAASVHKAVLACLLAPATRQQLQHLRRIAAHPQAPDSSLYNLLHKLCGGKIVGKADLADFAAALRRVRDGGDADTDGSGDDAASGERADDEELAAQTAAFKRTALAHNVQAVARMFRNITLARLAAVCGVDDGAEAALALVTAMVTKGTIAASIDQTGGLVQFSDAAGLAEARHAAAVRSTCHAANDLYFDIRAKHAELDPHATPPPAAATRQQPQTAAAAP